MSVALDARIDAARRELIELSGQSVGMSNARQMKRSYEELMLELINVMDALNAQADEITPSVLEELRKAVKESLAASEGEK